ncbi:MAG TPA: penicillin acylase family protein [Candidatus Baltobacteraceae bacterium]|nr:penicillin acylase family protein [Candidatus Baltobacteraceae bacterium]
MSVFVRKDPRLLACRDPSWPAALWTMLRRHACAAAMLVLLFALSYVANVAIGLRAAAQTGGVVSALPITSEVTIARDSRGIPHIRARTLHDLFFAQGFAEASDRLFQMDVTRRYAYGRLAEVFGARALPLDEDMRAADVGGIAERERRGSDAQTQRMLQAFSDGVNAAMTREPLPVEFRMLLYRPRVWTPEDSIAVSVVAAFELGDSWHDVLARDSRWKLLGPRCYNAAFPLSDPRYDVTVDARMLHAGAAASSAPNCDAATIAYAPQRTRTGSNAWGAGSDKTLDRHAILANDPHVDLTIPGIWYAVDLQAPGLHAAGAVIPGLPGVALGHNERIAWAVTNAQVATDVLYRTTAPPPQWRVLERFDVRFGSPVSKAYYRTADAFSTGEAGDAAAYFVRWPAYSQRRSTIATLLALDRAPTIAAALHALANYHGAPQNFILADDTGAIAYHLAGALYDDPAWGRYVHPARDLAKPLQLIAFSDLPARAPSRDAVLVSANNRMYGKGYRYRLSAAFEPPYRAYRIATLLHERSRYDASDFARMQMDVCSPIDREIARDVLQITRDDANARTPQRTLLAHWNGCFTPSSNAASLEYAIRNDLLEQHASLAYLLSRLRTGRSDERDGVAETAAAALWPLQDAMPWGQAGRVAVDHPLSPSWYGMLSGATLPGAGDAFTVHLQEPGFAQGFRAVWDVGNWDAGGLVLPSGESGEPGSGHYDDLAAAWIRGRIIALPFTRAAVARATVSVLALTPR